MFSDTILIEISRSLYT